MHQMYCSLLVKYIKYSYQMEAYCKVLPKIPLEKNNNFKDTTK